MSVFIFPYSEVSESSKDLADSLGIRRIRRHKSKFTGGPNETVINWGCSELPTWEPRTRILNRSEHVSAMTNKRSAFRLFQQAGVRVPDFTESHAEATRWLEAGNMVFARTVLTGHSGNGIVVLDPDHRDTWEVSARLYVKYVKKKDEFRLHYFKDRNGNPVCIDVQRKTLRDEFRGQSDVNFLVRNLANGFIFQRNNITVPQDVYIEGEKAFRASNLDFGALDVIFNQHQGRAYILEINTSPGLQGSSLDNYTQAFRNLL